jgi:hypothetical protein
VFAVGTVIVVVAVAELIVGFVVVLAVVLVVAGYGAYLFDP